MMVGMVQGFGSGKRTPDGIGFQRSGFSVQLSAFGIQCSGFSVQVSVFRKPSRSATTKHGLLIEQARFWDAATELDSYYPHRLPMGASGWLPT